MSKHTANSLDTNTRSGTNLKLTDLLRAQTIVSAQKIPLGFLIDKAGEGKTIPEVNKNTSKIKGVGYVGNWICYQKGQSHEYLYNH